MAPVGFRVVTAVIETCEIILDDPDVCAVVVREELRLSEGSTVPVLVKEAGREECGVPKLAVWGGLGVMLFAELVLAVVGLLLPGKKDAVGGEENTSEPAPLIGLGLSIPEVVAFRSTLLSDFELEAPVSDRLKRNLEAALRKPLEGYIGFVRAWEGSLTSTFFCWYTGVIADGVDAGTRDTMSRFIGGLPASAGSTIGLASIAISGRKSRGLSVSYSNGHDLASEVGRGDIDDNN